MNFTLDWLPQTAFTFVLIFGRVGTMLMLMPAFGENNIPARLRLSFALAFTLVVFPLVASGMPTMPDSLAGMGTLLGHEMGVGFIIGGIARMIVMATQTAGSIIAFQMGLSVAMASDPSQPGLQGAIIGNFLTLLGVALIFVTDLHYMVLAAVYDSYTYFPVEAPLMIEDAAAGAIEAFSGAFDVGVQMAAPFIVFGLVFYLGLGLLARLMPQLQVFFIAMPANVGIGLILLAVLLTSVMGWYLSQFENTFGMLLGSGEAARIG
ncbi:MAG TPA: flagellar type III secretion system protein FliR [Devosia sp.]|nr:flagellar type III secretion system protein FliR [Devosia sp.]